MPIDPLSLSFSLVGTLTSVIMWLQKQYDNYNTLQDNKRARLAKFWKAVLRLTDDLRTYEKFIKALHEGPLALARFINSNAADWDGFQLALDDIQNRYHHEPSNSAPQGKGVAKTIVASVIFTEVLTASIKQIEDITASLESDMEAIERAYQRLHTSYILQFIIHRQNTLPQRQATVLSDSPNAIDSVVSSFYQNPFHLSVTTVAENTLFRLNQNLDVAEKVTKVMKKEVASWAKRLIRSDSLDEFSRIQIQTMELLWAACIPLMESEGLKFARLGDEWVSDTDLKDLSLGLKSAIARAKNQSFSIAFCGMVKAGKSLFLNALMSRIIPSDELPSTAWPCRLRHVPGQSKPTLTFDPKPFQMVLARLQAYKFGSKMQSYRPPFDNSFDDTSDTNVLDPQMTANEDYTEIYYNWKDLPQQTRKNLLEFENPNFELLSNVEGPDQVAKLLGQINDIVRLCDRFKLGFLSGSGEWPLLCAEFESLRDQQVEGTFEFIDLPGLGEKLDTFDYEEMITRVAKEANAIVPIVSFKEIVRQDWPSIIDLGLQTRASMMICTHIDQISRNNLNEQIMTVAKVFWSEPSAHTHRVIHCSSKMGLSAAILRHLPADSVCNADPEDIEYPCVTAILARAKQRVLLEEAMQFQEQVGKIITNQRHVLLEMRCSRDKFEAAREQFEMAHTEFTITLEIWRSIEGQREREYETKFADHCVTLQELGNQHVLNVLEETSKSTLGTFSFEPFDFGVESVLTRVEAEELFIKSQQILRDRLLGLKDQLVLTIHELADQASTDRVESLRAAIGAFESDMEAELRTVVELESLAVDVRILAFQAIQRSLKKERVRYSPSEVYRIIEGAVAKPILAFQDNIPDDVSPEANIKDLGLHVRAPVAVIATIPYIFSVGVWLCITKTKKYHCNMSDLAKHYQDKIVTPFLKDLKEKGLNVLKSALTQSSAVAKATIESTLQQEKARYKRESEEDKMPTNKQVAELVASHLNFVAAKSTFYFLEKKLVCQSLGTLEVELLLQAVVTGSRRSLKHLVVNPTSMDLVDLDSGHSSTASTCFVLFASLLPGKSQQRKIASDHSVAPMDSIRALIRDSIKFDDAPKSCTILSDPINAVIDIVFVHGFGGDHTDTWTSKGVYWPQDFLKSKLERARIITFAYDSDILQFLSQDDVSVSPCAKELLTDLTKLRADECQRDRALIFVVHSIGSTVVKNALSHSSSQLSGLGDIAQACRGVVFLGAAHNESRENFGQIAAKAAAAVQPSLGAEILRKLQERSSAFSAINESFLNYLEKRGKTFKSVTFYEKSEVNVTVERESARMDNRDHGLLGLTTDHCNMSKFVQLEDPNYVTVSNTIKDFYEDIIMPRRPGCEVLFDCPNALLDIIFVHTLGCNHTESWTHGKIYWPKELLPVDVPYARVIACHYQTDFAAFMKPDQDVILDLAIGLLLSLLKTRSNLPSHGSVQIRPLLFVAHSIGGTLVKQALNISHSSSQQAMHAISIATQGIIFLGTPHKNDGKLSIGQITAMAVRAGAPDLDEKVVEVIKRDPVFERFNNTFQDYLEKREPPVQIVSFCEQRSLLSPPIVVTKNCASLPTKQHLLAKLQGSHKTLGQFKTQDDYKRIIKQIQAIAGQRATGNGCNTVCDPPGAQIDIIFVPGLRRGVMSAWTHEGLCWPRDLLGLELPDARIILYGYNADASDFFNLENENSIFSCARDMLSDLKGIRGGDAQKRPILFVAHSTGGLLVKNVITQSQGGHDQGVVAACLRGVIFLGTPHRRWDGSDSKAISFFIKRLGSLGQSLPKQPDLKHSKQILQSVTASFSELIRAKSDDVILWSFFEEEPMPGIGLVVDKFTAESDDPPYQMQSIPATHIDMPKVVSNEDEGYRRLLGAIKQACNPVPSRVISDQELSENSPTGFERTGDLQGIGRV